LARWTRRLYRARLRARARPDPAEVCAPGTPAFPSGAVWADPAVVLVGTRVAPAPVAAAPATDDASEIERLASLHASGALSDEEFTAAKQKILGL